MMRHPTRAKIGAINAIVDLDWSDTNVVLFGGGKSQNRACHVSACPSGENEAAGLRLRAAVRRAVAVRQTSTLVTARV
jgi:hypothetical protein